MNFKNESLINIDNLIKLKRKSLKLDSDRS
jgi:hypothetical protein